MKLEKSTKQLESSPINMFTCEEDLLKASSRLLYLWFWEGILKGIKEFLYKKGLKLLFLQILLQICFYPFLTFSKNQKQESNSQQIVGLVTKDILFSC